MSKAQLTRKPPTVLAKSLEKFTAMTFGHIRIQDSLQFLNCSLDKLVSNLRERGVNEKKTLQETYPTAYTYFKNKWPLIEDEAFELLTRKGVYPYEYINSWDKFNESKLPGIDCFHSKFTNSNISNEDYRFAQELWSKFCLQNIGDLHDLYMNTDVMLLGDVFESFRCTTLVKYNLDPAHFVTAPSLSWSACLKMTKVQLELITDPNMSMFIDMALYGGISSILSPHAKANPPNLPD